MCVQLFNSRWYDRIASLPPILISAVFHEYVLWAPARFVLPLLLIMFGLFGSKFVSTHVTISVWVLTNPSHAHRHHVLCEAKLWHTLLELLSPFWPQFWSQYNGVCVCHRILCSQDLLAGGDTTEYLHSTVLRLFLCTELHPL